MTIIDPAALAAARERLENVSAIYGHRVHEGTLIEIRVVDYADLRLVLDALRDARKERDAMHGALREIAHTVVIGDDPVFCNIGIRNGRGAVFSIVTRKTFDLLVSLKSADLAAKEQPHA